MHKRRKTGKPLKRQNAGRTPAVERPARHADLLSAVHALVSGVSKEEWRKLPPNLAARVDEILYDHDK